MGYELTGKLTRIFDTKQVSERFTKREFVVETSGKYPQVVLCQATGDRIAQLDGLNVGDSVRVEFNLRGREWRSPKGEVKYFTTLDVWRVEPAGDRKKQGTPHVAPPQTTTGEPDDDIPFLTADMTHEPSPIARVLR